MVFAQRVFQIAGVYGLAVVLLGYGFFFVASDEAAVVTNHPEYVHGFFLAALAWQVAFLIISTDPARYRPLMLAAMLEKFPFTLAILLLYAADAVGTMALAFGLIDGLLGVLFAIAYLLVEREARTD